MLSSRRQDIKHAGRPATEEHIEQIPAVTVYLDESHWDTHARERGGTSNSLVGAFAAQLATKVGRLGPDGRVTLSMPVNERTEGDHRANAMTSVMFAIDPAELTTDLRGIRRATKEVLSGLQDTPDEKWALLPLTPFIPKAAARRLADVALEYNDYPVGCSNVGPLDPDVNRPDGTHADYVFCKLAEQRVRPDKVLSTYGQLFLASGRVNEKIFLAVVGYQPGVIESRTDLTNLLTETLEDFGMRGVIE
ncbi:Fatty acyl-AMP ligase FadD28 and polyketide synthase [Mycobacteroides abscessus subsp. massiliense]|nr:Fatty acyl-AMP ligase FadD28 and polyketide synthase [Mycobacteroides abscessus subsp. massiliense]